MLNSIKNRDELEKVHKLISLQSQIKALGLQDELGNQTFKKT